MSVKNSWNLCRRRYQDNGDQPKPLLLPLWLNPKVFKKILVELIFKYTDPSANVIVVARKKITLADSILLICHKSLNMCYTKLFTKKFPFNFQIFHKNIFLAPYEFKGEKDGILSQTWPSWSIMIYEGKNRVVRGIPVFGLRSGEILYFVCSAYYTWFWNLFNNLKLLIFLRAIALEFCIFQPRVWNHKSVSVECTFSR